MDVSDGTEAGQRADGPACYRHPRRPALARCSRCERPICDADLIDAPVGYQCPACAEGGRPVRRLADLRTTAGLTRVLVGVIAVVFVLTQLVPGLTATFGLRPALVGPSGPELFEAVFADYRASAPARVLGEPWLLLTSALLHANLMHVAFNGLLLWQLGHLLEPALGRARYVALCLAGTAGGGLGVVALSWATVVTSTATTAVGDVLGGNPFQPTIGASGMVFGLMGAALVGLRSRGIDPWRSGIGALVVLNLVITFVVPGISVGGHVGGLAGGALAGRWLFVERGRARAATTRVLLASLVALGLAVVLAEQLVAALLR